MSTSEPISELKSEPISDDELDKIYQNLNIDASESDEDKKLYYILNSGTSQMKFNNIIDIEDYIKSKIIYNGEFYLYEIKMRTYKIILTMRYISRIIQIIMSKYVEIKYLD